MRAIPLYTTSINILEDARVSGTPRVIQIQDADGTAYYLKAYPTYGGTDEDSDPEGIKSWSDAMIWGDPVVIGFDRNGIRCKAKAYPMAGGLSDETKDPANSSVGILADERVYGDVYVAGVLSDGVRYYFKVLGQHAGVSFQALPMRICNRCLAVWIEDDQMYEEVDRCPHCGLRVRPPAWEGKDDPMVGGWV